MALILRILENQRNTKAGRTNNANRRRGRKKTILEKTQAFWRIYAHDQVANKRRLDGFYDRWSRSWRNYLEFWRIKKVRLNTVKTIKFKNRYRLGVIIRILEN